MPNIIGDIAGRYDELMLLLKKMPDDEPISIGDMVDRGPNSKAVLDFFMKNGRAIMGNHEHMMWDWYTHQRNNELGYYDWGVWQYNGGSATIASFGIEDMGEHVKWIRTLPKYIEIDDYLISHAFLHPGYQTLEQGCDIGAHYSDLPKADDSLLWNRSQPIDREWSVQICGHNSQFGLRQWTSGDVPYALCLDDSRKKVLTGVHMPSGEIFQQPYLE
jgi:hypothetical protein